MIQEQAGHMLASLKIRTIKRVMTGVIALLFVLHMISQYGKRVLGQERLFGIGRMFHLDGEQNIPTYVNGLLLAVAATLLWLIWGSVRQSNRRQGRYWFWLGCVFWYMSMDDMLRIHERMDDLAGKFGSAIGLPANWIFGGLVITAVVGFFFLRFWLRLPCKTRFWFAVSAGVYLGGALGAETISMVYLEHIGHANKDMVYGTLTGIEETMEMAGIAVFITALSRYICNEMGICGIRLIATPDHRETPATQVK